MHPGTHKVVVPAMGTVIPAREITLESRVSGEIVDLHPEFTITSYARRLSYRDPAQLDRFVDGLRKAGLPE